MPGDDLNIVMIGAGYSEFSVNVFACGPPLGEEGLVLTLRFSAQSCSVLMKDPDTARSNSSTS